MIRTSWRAWSISCSRPSTTVSPASTSSSPGPILPGLSSISSAGAQASAILRQVHGRAGARRGRHVGSTAAVCDRWTAWRLPMVADGSASCAGGLRSSSSSLGDTSDCTG